MPAAGAPRDLAEGVSFQDRIAAIEPAGRRRVAALAALTLLLWVLTWTTAFRAPAAGLDFGWAAGLYMASERGLQFGTDIVFTFGPFGFLGAGPSLWFQDLAAISFVYLVLLQLAYCGLILHALGRSIGLVAGFFASLLVLSLVPSADQTVVVMAALAMTALAAEREGWAPVALNYAGPAFAALQMMIKLSLGPIVAAIGFFALIGTGASARRVAGFAAMYVGWVVALWLLAGEGLAQLPDYLRNSLAIITGYNEAMGVSIAPAWQLWAGVALGLLLVVVAWFGDYETRRGRIAGVAVMGVVAFTSFKYGAVRFEANHVAVMLSTLAVAFLVIPARGARRLLTLGGAMAAIVVTLIASPGGVPSIDPVAHARAARHELGLALDPQERRESAAFGKAILQSLYDLDPKTLALLDGESVAIDPWEITIAWAFDLDWSPLPVIQGYQALTSGLDELNSERLEGDEAPERILRVDPAAVGGEYQTRTIDGRFPAWDPPEQAVATLCNYVPLHQTERLQVLGKVDDRCGEPESIGTVEAAPGETVDVPQAGPGEVVLARVQGAEVAGLERIRSLLYKPRPRTAIVNGEDEYRLVPGTADDGLLMNGDPAVIGEGAFAQAPQARTLAIDGAGEVSIEFERIAVEPTALERAEVRRGGSARRGASG